MRGGKKKRHLEHVGPTSRSVRSSFSLGRIVFDDPEVDDFVELVLRADFEFIGEQQAAHPDWNQCRRERMDIYPSRSGWT